MKKEQSFLPLKKSLWRAGWGMLSLCSLLVANGQSAAKKRKESNTVKVYTTAQNTPLRLSPVKAIEWKDAGPLAERYVYIFLDDTHRFQTMIGIGGAITDASAETFAKLPAEKQTEILTAYYDPKAGIGYTLARTHIQSCDFSSGSYSYVADNDKSLKTFSIHHDEQYRIPLIKKAMAAAGRLTLFVTPWSPPGWMKSNNDMLHGGTLLPQYKQAWADFYVKFIRSYENEGIPVWGLSVQNEPMAVQKWESCIYTATEERDFIKNYLGPTLQKSGLGAKKLIAWDHNRDLMFHRAQTILNDPQTAKYVWGIGYHWYETWTGGNMQFTNEQMVQKTFPQKNLLFTEGSVEAFDPAKLDNWGLGEKYGYSMINDFNAGTVGWTDWNILLDEKGGPNHVGNYCFAPVHADTRSGQLHYTNAYYYIGHFSKFIHPGARRINASSNRSDLLTTAFQNPDGSIAVVVMNSTDTKMDYVLHFNGKAAQTSSLPHSITTLVF